VTLEEGSHVVHAEASDPACSVAEEGLETEPLETKVEAALLVASSSCSDTDILTVPAVEFGEDPGEGNRVDVFGPSQVLLASSC